MATGDFSYACGRGSGRNGVPRVFYERDGRITHRADEVGWKEAVRHRDPGIFSTGNRPINHGQ
jgi:hypothetical protein